MLNIILSALGQVIVFALIPLIVYLIQKKKFSGFFQYIGLKKSNRRANGLGLLLAMLLAIPVLLLAYWEDNFQAVLTNPKSVTGAIRQMGPGLPAIISILAIAIFKTALAEEVFFRGFLAKRLIAITNFTTGNWIQAILFGLLHSLLFLSITNNPWFLTIIFIIPTIGAYIKTYLNEKLAGGSIVPGWIAHASANLLAYSVIVFLI